MNKLFAENKEAKIYVAGHQGMVGSAIMHTLKKKGYNNQILKTRQELDIRNQAAVQTFYNHEKPDYVFIAAAKVGGILANDTYPAEFLYDNMIMEANLIHGAYTAGVKKLLFLGSSCIYPKMAPQPLKEEYLLSGPLEPTNEWYAVAKIAGLKLCQAYRRQYGFDAISVMPTNLYGPGDNFHLENSHVMPALIRRFYEATISEQNQVTVWGTGKPRREFLHVDDFADSAIFLMERYSSDAIVNVGVGKDISIQELTEIIKSVTSYKGNVLFDQTKPDGTLQKLLDVSKLTNLGWKAKISLPDGVTRTYLWYVENLQSVRQDVF